MLKIILRKIRYWKHDLHMKLNGIRKCMNAMKKYKALEKVPSTPEHTAEMMQMFYDVTGRSDEDAITDKTIEEIRSLVNACISTTGLPPKYLVVGNSLYKTLVEYGYISYGEGVNEWPEIEVLITSPNVVNKEPLVVQVLGTTSSGAIV